jgi:hypothetical protein
MRYAHAAAHLLRGSLELDEASTFSTVIPTLRYRNVRRIIGWASTIALNFAPSC